MFIWSYNSYDTNLYIPLFLVIQERMAQIIRIYNNVSSNSKKNISLEKNDIPFNPRELQESWQYLLIFLDRFWLSFFYSNFPAKLFFTQLTFGNCVKIPNFGKCENWKNIHNHRTVTADSRPVVGHYAGKVLTGDYPEKANREGIAASSR